MKKLMIDLDETICEGGYLEAVNAYLKTNYQYEDIPHYYVEDVMNEEEKEKFLDYFYQNVNIYQNVQVVPKALEVIEELAKYYEVYIVTAFVDNVELKKVVLWPSINTNGLSKICLILILRRLF